MWPLVLSRIYACFIKAIVLAPWSARLSTSTAPYLYSCYFTYVCVPCHCQAGFESTALRAGVKALYNANFGSHGAAAKDVFWWVASMFAIFLRVNSSRRCFLKFFSLSRFWTKNRSGVYNVTPQISVGGQVIFSCEICGVSAELNHNRSPWVQTSKSSSTVLDNTKVAGEQRQ